MDPALALDEATVQVEPGGEVRATVTVHHHGDDVGRYRMEVLGDAARWAQVEPRHVSAAPGADGQVVELVFRPPHVAVAPARRIPFAVRALSLQDRDRVGVVEGEVVVAPVRDLDAGIEPAAVAGRWGAGYRVALHNRGNWPVTVRVTGADPGGGLRFAVSPAESTVPPGGSATALVSVRTRRPRLAGRPQRHAVGVEYRGEGAASGGRLSAVFEQRPVLHTVVAALLALVVAALVVGAAVLGPGLVGRSGEPGADPTAPPSAAPATGTGEDPVSGFIAIYGPPRPVDDVAGERSAQQFADTLRAAGVDARVVDSRTSEQLDDGLAGLLVVLKDGFADRATATAECAAQRAVAPSCVVVAPR